MHRLSPTLRICLVLVLVATTGCHPTQPFYLHEQGDLAHYLDKAQQVEHADVQQAPLPDVDQSRSPITLSNPEFDELWDLTLEEVVHISLANTKIIRGGQTPRIQQGQIFAGTQEGSLIDVPLAAASVYNPAIRESGTGGESGTGVEAALANFDTQMRVIGSQGNNGLYNRTDRPQNVTGNIGFPQQLLLDNGGLISSLSKRSATGTTFTALNQTDYSRGNQRGTQFQPLSAFWTTTLETRVDQPLLRNRGEQVNRAPVIIARIGTDTELANLEDQLQKMVANIEVRYWDLHRSYRDLEAAKIGRDTTLTTWRTVYERFSQGVEPAQAEAQAREQYFQFRASVESALRDLHNNENELRFLMGIAVTDGRLIRPIDEPSLARVQFDWSQSLAEALLRRPELRQRRWEIKRREMELIVARNQLLPQLDIGAYYRFVGVGNELVTANGRPQDFPAQGSTAVDSLFGGNFQELGFTFQFQQAIGNRRELAGVRNAQLNLSREKALLEDSELEVSHSLARGIRNMDANYNLAQTHYNRMAAAFKEVEAAQAVYEQGVGQGRQPLDLLLDATRRRSVATQAYYQAICEYNKSISDVHMRKGSILDYCGVGFEEGPWSRKAYWDALARARERDASMYLDYGWTRPRVVSQGPLANPLTNNTDELPLEEGTPSDATLESLPEVNPDAAPKADAKPDATEGERIPNELGPETKAPKNTFRTASLHTPVKSRSVSESRPAGGEEGFEWGSLGLTEKPNHVKTSESSAPSPAAKNDRRETEPTATHHSPARAAARRALP